VTRGGGVLRIGTPETPFTASATAASRSLLAPQATPLLSAQLSAIATVRGLEGAAADAPASFRANPSTGASPFASGAPGLLPTFYGQPSAAVQAAATLDLDPGPTASASRAVADAKGIEGYQVFALAPGASASGLRAQLGGSATASLLLQGASPSSNQPAALTATAIGIDHAALRGPTSGAVQMLGSGLALLDAASAPPAGSVQLNRLQGIGILAGDIQSNGGAPLTNEGAQVIGMGGFAAPRSGGLLPGMDAAGIDRSTILTGSGNDAVMGVIYTEKDSKVDANGDGVLSPEVFLDASALTGGQGGFDGIRNSVINTGGGNDGVYGSASASAIDTGSGNDQVIGTASGDGLRAAQGFVNTHVNTGTGNDVVSGGASGSNFLMGLGDDAVTLVASEGSVLDGGIGNDNLRVTGASSTTRLDGGIGKDQLQGGSGADDLSGGIGSDVIRGGAGADRFHFTGADMLTGTDKLVDFNGSEGDKLMLSSNLTGFEKGTAVNFVTAAQAQQAGFNMDQAVIVDSMANIQAMGSVSHSHLAYATDTGALLYDANGDWSQGSRTVAVLNDNGKNANLTAANIEIS